MLWTLAWCWRHAMTRSGAAKKRLATPFSARKPQVVHLPGADCALSQSPTARQLAWMHEVFTKKLWCCCMSLGA